MKIPEPKKLLPVAVLGAAWAFMESRHQSPPPALTQALVAAAGAAFAWGGKKEEPDAKEA
jgi:hypothetical protein